jgi:hypothetical protein
LAEQFVVFGEDGSTHATIVGGQGGICWADPQVRERKCVPSLVNTGVREAGLRGKSRSLPTVAPDPGHAGEGSFRFTHWLCSFVSLLFRRFACLKSMAQLHEPQSS